MRERHREPRNGAKELLQRRFFRPVPGLVHWLRGPTAHAVGYVVSPSGLADLVAALPLCGAANSGCRGLSAGARRRPKIPPSRQATPAETPIPHPAILQVTGCASRT